MPVSSQWLANPSSTYQIGNSCCFNDDDSSYLSRTPGSAGNRRTWTWSGWVKRGNLGSKYFFGAVNTGTDSIGFTGTDIISIGFNDATEGKIQTNRKFRDPSAWYHIVVAIDTTNGTAGNRMRLYVNGTEETSFAADVNPSENYDTGVNNTAQQTVGSLAAPSGYFDGYLADVYLIDGSQLAASDFGETNDEGVWVPKTYSGSYGTNGIHLKFQDSSALGDDTSGNGNDYTANNLAATDQSTDTPTNNHCTLNVLDPITGSVEVTEGARQVKFTGGDQDSVLGTIFQSKGKWYWEMKYVTAGGGGNWGITRKNFNVSVDFGSTSGSYAFRSGGDKINNNSAASYGSAWSADDIIQCAWDADNGKVFFGINNTWQASGDPAAGDNPAYSSIGTTVVDGGGLGPGASSEGNTVYLFRFTEAECSYDPPTGFKHLNTANIAEPSIKDPSTNFQTTLFTGTGASRSVTNDGNSNLQPDLIMLTSRSNTYNNGVFDAARGTQKELQSNTTAAETTLTAGISSFDSDGFSFNGANYNTNTYTFVAWNWSAGNSGASNEDGTINTTTTYSDATAGISVSTYEGTGSAATIGHGLGVAPQMVIVKNRDATDDWKVYHAAVASDPQTDYLVLNTTAAAVDDATVWNDTAPTSTVFSIGTHTDVNTSGESYVAYCFVGVEGFSKFGSLEGNNNADGTFVYTGFSPEFIVQKDIDNAGQSWCVVDRARTLFNDSDGTALLQLNSDAAGAQYAGNEWDFLSNGWKMRGTGQNHIGTFVYMAFARNPFGGDGVAPATAV